jgi:hypothetical protein
MPTFSPDTALRLRATPRRHGALPPPPRFIYARYRHVTVSYIFAADADCQFSPPALHFADTSMPPMPLLHYFRFRRCRFAVSSSFSFSDTLLSHYFHFADTDFLFHSFQCASAAKFSHAAALAGCR